MQVSPDIAEGLVHLLQEIDENSSSIKTHHLARKTTAHTIQTGKNQSHTHTPIHSTHHTQERCEGSVGTPHETTGALRIYFFFRTSRHTEMRKV